MRFIMAQDITHINIPAQAILSKDII